MKRLFGLRLRLAYNAPEAEFSDWTLNVLIALTNRAGEVIDRELIDLVWSEFLWGAGFALKKTLRAKTDPDTS